MTLALLVLMVVQSALGLLSADLYRDVEWIRAGWYANDWFTLAVAVPLLGLSHRRAGRGAIRESLLSLGVIGYAVYNYAFYLFGATLNVFFPLYVLGVVGGAVALFVTLSKLEVDAVARSFRPGTPTRLAGGHLVFVSAGLTGVWLGMWGAYVFGGRPTPIEPEAFKVVAALDLCLMVPALATGGALLWRGDRWGYVIAPIAATQAAMYLFVLSAGSLVAVQRGLTPAPGEFPIWMSLAALTSVTAGVLLKCARGGISPTEGPALSL